MAGFVLIAFGILYLLKPDLFSKGIWANRSDVKNKTPAEYRNKMRLLGVILIIAGLVVLFVYGFPGSTEPVANVV